MKILALVAVVPFALGFLTGSEEPEPEAAEEVVAFADPAIIESSGLAVVGGRFVTVNDSGGSGRIFTVAPDSGRTVGTTGWPGDPVDIEGLAPAGDGEVWVGDIGDNQAVRSTITIHRVPSGRGDQTTVPTSYELDYPDGPHDAETLLTHPVTGRVYVVSKEFTAGRVYEAPADLAPDEPNRMRSVGEVVAIATDGAFFPDGRHVLIRGYSDAVIYSWPDLEQVAEVDLPFQQQGEGVAIAPDGAIYLSSEGVNAPVLRLDLPEDLRNLVDGVEPEPEPEPAPEPEPDQPLWPYLFMGGLGVVVVYGVVRLFRGGNDG